MPHPTRPDPTPAPDPSLHAGHAPWHPHRLERHKIARARMRQARAEAARIWSQGADVAPILLSGDTAADRPATQGRFDTFELGRLLLSTLDLGPAPCGWQITPRPGCVVMLRAIRGGQLRADGHDLTLPAGEIALLAPGGRIDLHLPEGGRHDVALLQGVAPDLPPASLLGTDLPAAQHLAFLAGYLPRGAPHPVARAHRLRDELVCALEDVIADLHAHRPGRPAAQVERFTFLLNANLARPDLGVADIAQAMNMPVRQLQRLLAAQGLNFRTSLHRKRLEHARALLTQGPEGLRISEVAYRCGFRDPNHFSRSFTRYWKVQPSRITPT